MYHFLFQGKAKGDRGTLWIRSRLQQHLHALGTFLDAHAGKVLFVSLLAIATFCVGLKSATFHSSIDQLWVTDAGNGGVQHEAHPPQTQPISDLLATHQMIVQTPADPESSLLHPKGLLEHLKLVQQAAQVTVTMFDM